MTSIVDKMRWLGHVLKLLDSFKYSIIIRISLFQYQNIVSKYYNIMARKSTFSNTFNLDTVETFDLSPPNVVYCIYMTNNLLNCILYYKDERNKLHFYISLFLLLLFVPSNVFMIVKFLYQHVFNNFFNNKNKLLC